jgi:hypothetical protein
MSNYPYIRAWGRLLHSHEYYIESQIADARRERAPADAIYYDFDNSRWATFSELKARADNGNLTSQDTVRHLEALVS